MLNASVVLVLERRSTRRMSSKSSSIKNEVKEKNEANTKSAPRKPSRASRREKKNKDVGKEPVEKNGAGDPVDMIFMDI